MKFSMYIRRDENLLDFWDNHKGIEFEEIYFELDFIPRIGERLVVSLKTWMDKDWKWDNPIDISNYGKELEVLRVIHYTADSDLFINSMPNDSKDQSKSITIILCKLVDCEPWC